MTRLEQVNQELKQIESGKSVMDYILDLKHQKLSNERMTLQATDEMKTLPEGTKLYFVSVRFSSTGTGNHESFDVYYIKDGELIKVWMPSLMKSQKGYNTSKYLWYCSGGNYSFTQKIADSISYAVFEKPNHFKDVRL